MAPQLLHRAVDALARHLGRHQRLGGAKDDEILEREAQGLARAARGRDEPRIDQRADGAARQAQELLHLLHAVLMHYFLAALRVAGFAASTFLAGFFSKLARKASIRSITCPPGSGGAAMVISWPWTFFSIADSTRSRTSSLYAVGSNFSEACCSMSCC